MMTRRLSIYLVLVMLSAGGFSAAMSQERRAPERSVRVRGAIPPVRADEPVSDTLPPAPEPRCDSYARSAVDDFRTMQRFPQCLVRNDARWQPNYQAHYGWCAANLGQHPDWVAAETRARTDHLIKCGVRNSY
jgi:hypothetical protein